MPKALNLTHSEAVRVAIEEDIFTGRLPPGAHLDEEMLAKRFSVSRTPVREAMLQLVQSGLVEKKPRQGAVVARANISHLIKMFEVISELEGVCAKLAARRMTEEERKALVETHRLSEEYLKKGDQEAYYTYSRKFHLHIVFGTHNKVLTDMVNKLSAQLVPYRRFQLSYTDRPQKNFDDHCEILAAILAGNSEEAGNLARKHTTVQGDVLAEYIALDAVTAD